MLSGLTVRAYRRTKQTNDLCGIEIEHQHIDDSLVRATMNGDNATRKSIVWFANHIKD